MKIISEITNILGEEILFSIYPVLVEKIVNGELYLGQGGKQFKKVKISSLEKEKKL